MKDWLAKIDELDTLVRRDSRKAYDFYQDGAGASPKPAGRGLGRYVSTGKALFLSFLRKLNPARRISYLAGLGLFLWGFLEDNWMLGVLGFIVLNFLLALELAEKLLTKN